MTRLHTKQILLSVQILLLAISFSYAQNEKLTNPRQRAAESSQLPRQAKRNSEDDQHSSETHHNQGGVGGRDHSKGAKYFMYAHQPDKKSYEFGYKRGNDHHVIERYEKAGPKHNFKTKVRWHDAHGGHGEQYWDYNHAPKHHDDHPHDPHHHQGGQAHYSEPVPSIIEAESATSFKRSDADEYKQSKLYKRSGFEKKPSDILKKSSSKKKTKMNQGQEDNSSDDYDEVPSAFPAVLGFDPYVPPKIVERLRSPPPTRRGEADTASSAAPPKNFGRRSQRPYKSTKERDVPKLAYDLDTGRVYDEKSGRWFKLVQV